MLSFLPWLALLLGCIGNCGFWLFCFNRVNALGMARPLAKLGEKLCMVLCFLIPGTLFWVHSAQIKHWIASGQLLPLDAGGWLVFWLLWNLASLIVLGPIWLESRRWLAPPKYLAGEVADRYRVNREVPGGSAGNLLTRLWGLAPLNQWATLEVTRKVLLMPREILAAEGLTIGHVSDLHFTGQYRTEHYQFVFDRLMDLRPDLIVISGDIIDFQHCVESVDSTMGRLHAPLGVHFVLGNHERRLKDVQVLVDRLNGLGFHDLGVSDRIVKRRDLTIRLMGDERPWFRRHRSPANSLPPVRDNELRIGVAHTPDRIHWARRLNMDLLLAGHTHGGQVRIPGIGPIVAPSLHGSKFASGLFYLPPTLLHVSRGVAGTHTLRWRCSPEISLLTLTNLTSHSANRP